MVEVRGTSVADKIYNTAISYGYTPEAAAAIVATISIENAGAELIKFKGERFERYNLYCENEGVNPNLPDSKIAYIFYDLPRNKNYSASRIKYSSTIDEAVRTFNQDYLNKTLTSTQFITLTILANDINKIFVSNT